MEPAKLREIRKLLENNESVRKIANKFKISHMTVQRIKKSTTYTVLQKFTYDLKKLIFS